MALQSIRNIRGNSHCVDCETQSEYAQGREAPPWTEGGGVGGRSPRCRSPRLSSAVEGAVHDVMVRKALKCFCLDFNTVPCARKPL